MVIEKGQRFTIRDGKTTLGTGVVTDHKKNLTEDERLEVMGGRKQREKNARLAEEKATKGTAKKGKK